MKNNLRFQAAAILGAAGALLIGSCAYDPSYGSGGYGATNTSIAYGTGYGQGFGGSSFSTSLFVSTGNPRWGYDPYCRSYYDFQRRSYYDPYLYGYYPIGFRPPILVGVPHPYGYRSGSRYCPPPSRVTNITLVNYNNRAQAYRNSNHSWARNAQVDNRPITVRPPGGRDSQAYRQTDRRGSQPTGRPSYDDSSGRPQPTEPYGGFNRGGVDPRQQGTPRNVNPSPPYQRGGPEVEPRSRSNSGRPNTVAPPTRFNTPVAVPPQAPSRVESVDRRSLERAVPRSAPETRFVPQPRSAPEPRSAPTPQANPEPRSAPPQIDPGQARGIRSGPVPESSGPVRGERRPR